MRYGKDVPFDTLKGKTLISVDQSDDEIIFTCLTGEKYKMFHNQSCCESVELDDVNGDLQELIGRPLVMAEMVESSDIPPRDRNESHTWTFYKLATDRAYVTLRWYGASNGCYSESVDFQLAEQEKPEYPIHPVTGKPDYGLILKGTTGHSDPGIPAINRNPVLVELLREWLDYATAKHNGIQEYPASKYTKLVANTMIQVGLADAEWKK